MVFNPGLLIKGKKYIKTLECPQLKEIYGEGTVEIRPLSSDEWKEVEAKLADIGKIQSKGNEANLNLDVSRLTKNEFEAQCIAVAYALSIEGKDEWKPKTVGEIRPACVVDRLFKEVIKITGVTPESVEELKSFHEDQGGGGDSDT